MVELNPLGRLNMGFIEDLGSCPPKGSGNKTTGAVTERKQLK